MIIQSFTSNLDTNIRTRVIEDLWHSNFQICECIKYIGIAINVLDIMRIVQFRIPDFIILPKLFQQLS